MDLDDLSDDDHRRLEQRLRYRAKRQGLRLERSRCRTREAYQYGTYWLLDAQTKTVVAGDTNVGYGMSLDAIDAALDEPDQAEAAR